MGRFRGGRFRRGHPKLAPDDLFRKNCVDNTKLRFQATCKGVENHNRHIPLFEKSLTVHVLNGREEGVPFCRVPHDLHEGAGDQTFPRKKQRGKKKLEETKVPLISEPRRQAR